MTDQRHRSACTDCQCGPPHLGTTFSYTGNIGIIIMLLTSSYWPKPPSQWCQGKKGHQMDMFTTLSQVWEYGSKSLCWFRHPTRQSLHWIGSKYCGIGALHNARSVEPICLYRFSVWSPSCWYRIFLYRKYRHTHYATDIIVLAQASITGIQTIVP